MLKQNVTAWAEMYKYVRKTQQDVQTTQPKEGKRKSKLYDHCLSMRALAGNMFAEYLQEHLCRKYLNRGVPFIDCATALELCNKVSPFPQLLQNDEAMMQLLEDVLLPNWGKLS